MMSSLGWAKVEAGRLTASHVRGAHGPPLFHPSHSVSRHNIHESKGPGVNKENTIIQCLWRIELEYTLYSFI